MYLHLTIFCDVTLINNNNKSMKIISITADKTIDSYNGNYKRESFE